MTEKKMQVLWLRFLTEINAKTREVPAELLENPEVSQALKIVEEAAYTPAEMRAYDKFWDNISVAKTLEYARKQEQEDFKKRIEAAEAEVLVAEAKVVKAKAQADEAKAQADEARAQADEAKAQADEAKAQADEAKAQADEARAQADEAKVQADEAKAQADEAKAKLQQTVAHLKTMNLSIDQIAEITGLPVEQIKAL